MRLLSLLFLCFIVNACGFLEGTGEEPMFIEVNDVNFNINPDQGAATFDIQDVSVYSDGFNRGLFPVPTKVPVLEPANSDEILVRAVIRNNGQQNNPIEYPFYQGVRTDVPFQAGSTVNLNPTFNYRPETKFLMVEDFELGHNFRANLDNETENSIELVSDALSGNFSGSIAVTDSFPFFEKAHFELFETTGLEATQLFMEMDYKTDVELRVGIIGYRGTVGKRVYKIILVPTEDWTKLYLEILPEVLSEQFESYQIVFSSLPGSASRGNVSIDNVKLLTF